MARSFANEQAIVNYHPGSRCCLPEQYRFYDDAGRKYPVFIRDCILLGYGSEVIPLTIADGSIVM